MLRLYAFMADYRANFTFKRKRVRPPVAARTVPAQYSTAQEVVRAVPLKGRSCLPFNYYRCVCTFGVFFGN